MRNGAMWALWAGLSMIGCATHQPAPAVRQGGAPGAAQQGGASGAAQQGGAPGAAQQGGASGAAPSGEVVSLFILGEVHGKPEPCGCQSEPLGDVSRVAHLVRSAGHPALLLDAGGLRYDATVPPAGDPHWPEARLKAAFLERTWAGLHAVVGLQQEDLAGGLPEVADAGRIAANVQGVPGVRPWELRQVGPLKIGVTAVAGPAETGGAWPQGVTVTDPATAAQAAVDRLREQGAQVVVLLAGLGRSEARRLARQVRGVDLVVAGSDLKDGAEDPERVDNRGASRSATDNRGASRSATGDAWLLVPAQEAQRVVQVDLHLGAGSGATSCTGRLYVGPAAQRREIARLERRALVLREQLAGLKANAQADQGFVQTTAADLAAAEAALVAAQRQQGQPEGACFSAELLPVRRRIPQDPQVRAEMVALDKRVGDENLRNARPPQQAAPGQPSYVGVATCGGCHDDAVAFWRDKMVHHHAWQTLLDVGKQRSYECVGCHATGFEVPGGSNLLTLASWDGAGKDKLGPDLRAVQCESCHGPGSAHAKSPMKVQPVMARPGEGRCLSCHPQEHSDTFDYVPYLRDVLGPGHGAAKRLELGPGPTGHELRQAGLRKHAQEK